MLKKTLNVVSEWDLGKVSTGEGLLPARGHTHYVVNVVCGASWAIYINYARQLAVQCCERKMSLGHLSNSKKKKKKIRRKYYTRLSVLQ